MHKSAKICKKIQKFCKFLHFLLIFARLCIFLHAFFVLIFQAQKLCLCYFSRFFQLCKLHKYSEYLKILDNSKGENYIE